MKKVFSVILTTSIFFSMSLSIFADTDTAVVSSSNRNSKIVTIVSNSNADYFKQVNTAFSKGYDTVDVIFADSIDENTSTVFSQDISNVQIKERSKRYHIRKVRKISDYTGKNRIASSDGTPGITIKISKSRTISRSISGTFGAPRWVISAAIGWNVSASDTIAVEGSYKVPKKIGKKYVKKAILNAYTKYARKRYDVYYGYPNTRFAKKKGTGTAYKPIGVTFKKKIIYK